MATHAYVRYQDDQQKAIVPVRDIKGFKNSDDFASKVYLVKWTDDSGTSDFYRARVLLVGGKSSGAKFLRIFIVKADTLVTCNSLCWIFSLVGSRVCNSE